MLSDRGRQIFEERGIDERLLENNVYLFELLLQLEQFMKQKSIPSEYMLDENLLGRAMDNVLYHIEGTIGREGGEVHGQQPHQESPAPPHTTIRK